VSAEIKFCGITRAEDADFAVSLGAAYVGVIFAGGPRNLTVPRAMEVLAVVPRRVDRVGVFSEHSADEIARAADHLQLGVVQLHGESSPKRVAEIRRDFSGKIWAVCRLSTPKLPATLGDLVVASDGLLLDADVRGGAALGGTGITLPWAEIADELRQLREARGRKPVILAGGLRPENVAQAIATLGPDVVDVSSGVESAPGIKDHDRMRAFRDAVHHASTPI
jgi:phosphoribosylanthranilate isomerase